MMNFPKNWKCNESKEIKKELFSKFSYSPILIKILASRNIKTEEEISSFLNPTLKNLHNPELLPAVEKGIIRVKKAISNRENILIFGDYDTDGIVSSVLVYNFLKKLGLKADIYIPSRFKEGYDINIDFIKRVSKKGYYNLIICVDCGTNSREVRKYICSSRTNIDVIVCDHHQPLNINDVSKEDYNKEKENYIIINPKLDSSRYPFKHLSGAGVTFKFITAVLRNLDERYKKKFKKDYLTKLLDMVAISTIADIMPLIDENRIIVKKGLKMLKNTTNRGLKKMMEVVLKDKQEINTYDIGFIIAPRLNAAGRIKNAEYSVNLLKGDTESAEKLGEMVNGLNSLNEKRQNLQKKMLDEVVRKNDFSIIVSKQKIFIDKSKEWSEGVLGIVASGLVKKFNIPVILFKEKEGKLKGSGRSIEKFDLHKNLSSLRNFFEKFGGHEQACGITMDKSKFSCFKERMIKIACDKLDKDDTTKSFYYDLEVTFKNINSRLVSEIRLLQPFGVGNPKPIFVTRNCDVTSISYLKDEKHVRLKLKNNGVVFSTVMFNIDDDVKKKLHTQKDISVLYNIEENLWNGQKTTRLLILDIF